LLAMQYAPGVTLETLVGMRTSASAVSDPRYQWAEARPVLAQIAAGGGYAHSQGGGRGGPRPGGGGGVPGGGGVAAAAGGPAPPRAALLSAVERGRERMAPELHGGMALTSRADVYSFAVLAVELLTAAMPGPQVRIFGERGPFALAIERALDDQPERRFATID